jgi:hypothetical protein
MWTSARIGQFFEHVLCGPRGHRSLARAGTTEGGWIVLGWAGTAVVSRLIRARRSHLF